VENKKYFYRCDEFLDRLNALAKSCNFTRGDSELKHQVIYGCGSDKLRARAMEDDKITLENLIKLAKTIEAVDSHIETLKKENSSGYVVNQVRHGSNKRHVENLSSNSKENNKPKNTCMRCGGSYPHDYKKACPAIGKICNNCKKKNHFANQYKNKEAKEVQLVNLQVMLKTPQMVLTWMKMKNLFGK
jgi:hypothetical protein